MTRSSLLDAFSPVWVLDTGFRRQSGERNQPVCLCAKELGANSRLGFFFDRPCDNPFLDDKALFISYNAAESWKTFISLGWELPSNVIDLRFEYLNAINGLWQGNDSLRKLGTGLGDAMTAFGLDPLSLEDEGNLLGFEDLTKSSPEDRQRSLDCCWSKVRGIALLFEKMHPELDLAQTLVRGAYSKPIAWMEHNGLPISPLYAQVKEHRRELQLCIARRVEAEHSYGVYVIEGGSDPKAILKVANFDALVTRCGLEGVWPRSSNGSFSLHDEDAFEPMARLRPELESLRQARKSLLSLDRFGSAIGSDGRNRASVEPFGTVTGRNNPKAREFILSRPHWVRNLIAPETGRVLIHADIVAAEAGIAADASGDAKLIDIYRSGLDPYIEFAKSAGALPADAVRDKKRPEIEAVRSLYKVADLAIKYGMGGETLSRNLRVPIWEADRIIASHKRTYSTYWAWADAQVERAFQDGYISTAFGWTMAVNRDTRRNTVLNFPQQAACAELLRLTLVRAVEQGLGPSLCAPHHDAFYLDCAEKDGPNVYDMLASCFQDACSVVLDGRVELRLEGGMVTFPAHYVDKDGEEIWKVVDAFLADGSVGRISPS